MKIVKGLSGLIAVIITLVAAYYIFFRPLPAVDREPARREDKGGAPPQVLFHTPAPKDGVPPEDRAISQKETKVTIIIDDIGFNLLPVKELLKIDAPIAFAVLPHCPYSADAAEMIHGKRQELLLHLPMEAQDPNKNPGQGALFRRMGEPEIRQQLEKDLNAVPYVAGVNNHMGSAFMEDEAKLNIVLQELEERGFYFIDSRTTPASRAEALAKKIGIRFASRKLFMDNNRDQEIIFRNLLDNLGKNNIGSAVIIGHPYPGTVKALKEAVPLLKSRGIRIIPPSAMAVIIGKGVTTPTSNE